MTTISCPLCAGPLTLDEQARCLIGHEFPVEQLATGLEDGAARALWAAVRALEDAARTTRWRLHREPAATALGERAERAEAQAELLRRVLRERGDDRAVDERPAGW